MSYIEEARKLRPLIEKAVQSLDDTDALKAKKLYPKWPDLVKQGKVDTNGKTGYRFYADDGELYSCVDADPEFQADWVPGVGTSALYVRVNEKHAGTLADPIPADRGMEYTYGLYYLDTVDGLTYRCQRTGEADGGTVVLQHLPHELVCHYFAEVT